MHTKSYNRLKLGQTTIYHFELGQVETELGQLPKTTRERERDVTSHWSQDENERIGESESLKMGMWELLQTRSNPPYTGQIWQLGGPLQTPIRDWVVPT